MGNVMCIIGNKIDDLAHYGYKLLGKRNGQKVYRRVVEQPVARGFMFRTGYPDTFKLTEFAFVDDAGKVVKQSARRVGTYGKATDATRTNMSQYTKYDENFKVIKFHEVESMPRAKADDSLFRVNEQRIENGLFDQTLVEVSPNGTVTYAMRKTNAVNPHKQKPLTGEYYYSNRFGNSRANYTQELANVPSNGSKYVSEQTIEKGAKDWTETKDVPFEWSIESLRNPNFYKHLTGPGEVKTYTQWHW